MPRLFRLCFAPLLVLATLAPPATAQGFKWWQNDRYRSELGLTADQSRRLEEIFQSSVPTLRGQKKDFDEAETQFSRVMENGNDAAVLEQVHRVEAARSELNKTRALMLLRMRRALTTDQWVKLEALFMTDTRDRGHAPPRGPGK